ncbi:MAG: vitamin B12 dependent-methionine synthase activation domain-containing protein [Thermodesulfobacteriota bacterium]
MANNISLKLTPPLARDILTGAIRHLGYPGPEAVSDHISAQIKEGIEECLRLARVESMCRATDFSGLEKTAINGNGLRLETVNWTRLAARMIDIRELCCFAVTLGGAIDDRIRELGKAAMLKALMLDAAASVLAEMYADRIQQEVGRYYRDKGWQSSARFSPGYCDWPLKEGQEALIPFLRPGTIGIHVSSTGLMIPRKSVSGAIIAAKTMPTVSPCYLCVRECAHRRSPYEAGGNR